MESLFYLLHPGCLEPGAKPRDARSLLPVLVLVFLECGGGYALLDPEGGPRARGRQGRVRELRRARQRPVPLLVSLQTAARAPRRASATLSGQRGRGLSSVPAEEAPASV